MEKEVEFKIENNAIVISIDFELLRKIAESKPDMGYKVINKEKFTECVLRFLKEGDFDEDGSTAFERLIDSAIDDVYESGEDCIISTEENQ